MTSATVHWSSDGWRTAHDTPTKDAGLGIHYADLATKDIVGNGHVAFTFYWNEPGTWGNIDFCRHDIRSVTIES